MCRPEPEWWKRTVATYMEHYGVTAEEAEKLIERDSADLDEQRQMLYEAGEIDQPWLTF